MRAGVPLLAPTAAAPRACRGCPRRPPWVQAIPPPAAAAPRAGRGCPPVLLLRLPAPRPSAAAAKLKTLKPLQDAVEAPCPLAADCGSCMTKSLAYAAQIRHKHHQGRDTPRPACAPTSLPPTGSSMAPAPWPTAPRSAARRPADVLCCRRAALAGQRHYASRVRNHRLDVGMPVPSNVYVCIRSVNTLVIVVLAVLLLLALLIVFASLFNR